MPLSLPSVPIMSEDSNSSAFDLPLSGIEATDLSSLLSQFEEVSQSLDGISTPPETEPEKEAPTPPVIKSKPAQFKAQQCKSPAITPPATPPPEVLARIRAKRKRKLAIMLPTMLPAKLSGQPTASKTVNGGTLPELNNNKPGKIHTQTPVDGNVNTDYYDHIPDHDYCVNSPKMSPKRDKSEFVLNPDLCNSVPQPLLGQEEIVIDAGDTSVLNSDIQTDASQPDLEEGEVPQSPVLPPVSSSMTTSSKPAQKVREVPSVSKVKDRSRRKYRKRDASPVEDNDRYFDKIPAYFTTLSKPVKPPKKDRLSERQSGIRREDFIERDSSPSRHDPSVYDKLPAYYSCFTNSTRYDSRNQSEDQYDLEDLDSYPCAKKPRRNRYSVSRSRSRSYSRSRSRSYSRSRSRHRSLCRRRSYSSASGSSSSSRSSSRSRSYSRSKSRSRSRSYSHSRSYSRSRSRGRSRSRCDSRHRNWSRSSYSRSRSRSRSWSRSSSAENRRQERKELREKEKARQIEERRIVYVGKIPDGHTRRELRRRFSRFGDIDEVSVHFREYGDNYGFVTYAYTCDAYAAIEKGNDIPGEKRFDLCFGGRRQFCDTDYADLDGKKEIDEELSPLPTGASLDFDQLLKQAKMQQKKKR